MKLNYNESTQIMSGESTALKAGSIATLPNGITLNKLESSVATSLTTSMVNSSSALPVNVSSKETMPTASPANERINVGLDCNGQSTIVDSNPVSENCPQLLNASSAYRKQCNGISGSSTNNKKQSDSAKRPRDRKQANRRWSSQNGWSDGHGQSVGRTGRPTEPRTNDANAAYSRRNATRWAASSSEKRINSRDAQKQNLEDRKSVKILQRPSSVTKMLGHDDDAERAGQRDAAAAAHRKEGRKKTLSLNPDELEDLEILIEQIVKDGIDDANTDSDDDDDDDCETVLKCNSSEDCRTSSCGRINEISPPVSTAVEDVRAKQQTVANVYAAQLKVALKHMDALPPRFQRRLQTGMNQISGSDPALSKLMDEMLQPKENRASSSFFTRRDGERSREARERGSKKSIRNLLNDLALYDEETALPDSFTRRLSYSLCALHEPEKPNDLSMSSGDMSKVMSGSDPFQFRPPPIFPQRPLDKMFVMNGSYISDPSLVADPSFGYGKDFNRWHPDPMAMPSPIPVTQEMFTVNAPEFTSTNSNINGRHHEISGSVEGSVASLGITSDENQMIYNQPLPSSMAIYHNNTLQPEHANLNATGYHPNQFPMIPRMPVTANRNIAFGPMTPPTTNLSSSQSFVDPSMVPYASVPMPYDVPGRGYAPQPQVLMTPMSGRQYSNAVGMQVSDQLSTTAIASDLTPVQRSYAWEEWRPNAPAPVAVDNGVSSIALNRYGAPSAMNGVYYLPSASVPASLFYQQQQLQATDNGHLMD